MLESIIILLFIYLLQMSVIFLAWKSKNLAVSTIASAFVILPGIALIVWYDDILFRACPRLPGLGGATLAATTPDSTSPSASSS